MLKLVYYLYRAGHWLRRLPYRLLALLPGLELADDEGPLPYPDFLFEYRREALMAVWSIFAGLAVVFAMIEMAVNREQILQMMTGLTDESLTISRPDTAAPAPPPRP